MRWQACFSWRRYHTDQIYNFLKVGFSGLIKIFLIGLEIADSSFFFLFFKLFALKKVALSLFVLRLKEPQTSTRVLSAFNFFDFVNKFSWAIKDKMLNFTISYCVFGKLFNINFDFKESHSHGIVLGKSSVLCKVNLFFLRLV